MKLRFVALAPLFLLFTGCSAAPDAGPAAPPAARIGRAAAPLVPFCDGHLPDPDFTTGTLCTDGDASFDGYRYAEQIPHCARHVTSAMKSAVGAYYGIAKSDFPLYEFDHYIPLGLGGSTDVTNLWPQPIDEAPEKDALEQSLFDQLAKGLITQSDAVDQMRAWRPSNGAANECL